MNNKWTIINFEVYVDELKNGIIEVLAKIYQIISMIIQIIISLFLGCYIRMENIPTDIVYLYITIKNWLLRYI
jgi:hypothetical protein